MMWFFVFLTLVVATQLWLCFRVSRSSVPLAAATLLLGPVGAAYTMVRERGNEQTNVTVPFVANLTFCLALLMSGVGLLAELRSREAGAAEAAAPTTGLTTASLASETGLPAAPMPQLAPTDAVDALAADLRAMGVTSTVVRVPATARLPPGVRAAAQLELTPRPPVVATSPRPAAPGLSATFLQCDSTATCRGVAQAYMLQDAARRPRVLQNGAMVLLVTGARSAETEDLHRTVASSFRQLSQQP